MKKRKTLIIFFIFLLSTFGIIHHIISLRTSNPFSTNNNNNNNKSSASDANITTDEINPTVESNDNDSNLDYTSGTTTETESPTHSITSADEETNTSEQKEYTPNLVATFLGVNNYGYVYASDKDNFLFQFRINDEISLFKIDCSYNDYKVQNKLKVGYTYDLILDPDHQNDETPTITDVYELDILQNENELSFAPSIETIPTDDLLISGEPGKKTLKNFLTTAMMPVGKTLYVYGGGWNWQDDGASDQAKHIGMPIYWDSFFKENDEYYNYKNTDASKSYYPYGGFNAYYYAGADCSGYVGWTLYNTLESESGNDGYVDYASNIASNMASTGYGSFTQRFNKADLKPGCIMSMSGHIWICLGSCTDGSIVILHSTPSLSKAGKKGGGVQLSALGSKDSEAYSLCNKYMTKYYPEWSKRYSTICLDYSTYTSINNSKSGLFSWNIVNDTNSDKGLLDPDDYSNMYADEILADIFKDAEN